MGLERLATESLLYAVADPEWCKSFTGVQAKASVPRLLTFPAHVYAECLTY